MNRKISTPQRGWLRFAALILMLQILMLPVQISGLDQAELSAKLGQLVNSPLVRNADITIAVYDPADSSEIYAYGSNAYFIPASITKLFTSATALTALSPDFRFQTHIGYRGEIRDSVLTGDLVIEAGGDPSWTADFFPDGAHGVFEIWADSLAAHGVSAISGNVVVNTSLYSTQLFSSHWNPLDRARHYAPPVSALSFNENYIKVDVTGLTASRPAKVSAQYGYLNYDNRVKTTGKKSPTGVWYRRAAAAHTVILEGSVRANSTVTMNPSVDDPIAFCVQTMTDIFRSRGIVLSGVYTIEADPISLDPPTPLFSYISVELRDINKAMLKNSANLTAEMLFHYLGGRDNGENNPLLELCQRIGNVDPALRIVDGSGLSKSNRISAADIGRLLSHSYHQDWFADYLGSLPIAGVDGTLENRFTGAASQAKIFAKTGSMIGINNLAGYFRATDERLYGFVVICNDLKSTAAGKKWQETICDQLILFDGVKTPKLKLAG